METGLYYLQTRYYDSATGRFLNSDSQQNLLDGVQGNNLFQYCGNNPITRVDPIGCDWWHWVIGAVVVAACAIATVATCGGFAAAATAVCMVGSGIAAATTGSTVAAAAFIGSAAVYGVSVLAAASNSNSLEEFNSQGNWVTVAATVGGAVFLGTSAKLAMGAQTTTLYRSVSDAEAQSIKETGRFEISPIGMNVKQFGFDLSETRQFGEIYHQSVIVSVEVPTCMISDFYSCGVDTTIFRHGTLTVYQEMLDLFNQVVGDTIHFIK